MMVYKYYDSLTKEDLEFSVGSKQNVWEVKEPLMAVSYCGYDIEHELINRQAASTRKTTLLLPTEAAEVP
jgi:hypothetical protein